MSDRPSVKDLPKLLRDFALTDVKQFTLPTNRSMVEVAAADELDRLNKRLSLAEGVCRSLSLEPPLKLTGKRHEAFQAWSSVVTDQTSNWSECKHEWRESRRDYDLGGNRSEVICTKCGVPGERDDNTGEVFWPAT